VNTKSATRKTAVLIAISPVIPRMIKQINAKKVKRWEVFIIFKKIYNKETHNLER
jgi:hypothetical protein